MFPTDYIIFLQIILFLFISPGPPRIVIVSHTLNYGLNRSVWTAFGDISANIIQAILVVFLIGSLFALLSLIASFFLPNNLSKIILDESNLKKVGV